MLRKAEETIVVGDFEARLNFRECLEATMASNATSMAIRDNNHFFVIEVMEHMG